MTLAELRLLLGPLRFERAQLFKFVLASAIGAALPMLSILLMHQFLAGVLGSGQGPATWLAQTAGTGRAIWILALLLFATFLASALTSFYNTVVQQRLVRTIELDVMDRLVRHLLTLSVLVVERQSHGDMIEALREDVRKLRLVMVSAATILMRSFTAVSLVVAAVWLSPRLALVSFPILAGATVPTLVVARRIRRRAPGLRRQAYRVFDVFLEMLRGIRVIKIYRGENAEASRAVEQIHRYFADLLAVTRTEALGQVALQSLGGLSIVIIVIVGGFQVMDGLLTWPSLLAFLIAVRAAHSPLFDINADYVQMQRNLVAVQRIDEVLTMQPALRDRADARPFDDPLRRVAFDRVTFAYDAAGPVLRDVSFAIAQGEVLGVVGPSGAGKTTLLNLAARLFDPTSGAVLLNQRDAKIYRLSDLYNRVAIVTQDAFLFSTTVRENIRCGRPQASDAEVESAARAADVHDEIVALPEGYDTLVGSAHRALSGGQTQRVNIARAILKNATLLILDEATSNLDSIAEARVQRAIARLMQGRTTLVAAHRLSTLRNATRILVLERGRVAGLGTHDDLMGRCPLYRRMWNGQHSGREALPHSLSGRASAHAVK